MASFVVSIPDALEEFVEQQVRTRGYTDVSDYFRALLSDAREKETDARLETLLIEGLDSGDDIQITGEFWRELRAEAAQRLDARTHP